MNQLWSKILHRMTTLNQYQTIHWIPPFKPHWLFIKAKIRIHPTRIFIFRSIYFFQKTSDKIQLVHSLFVRQVIAAIVKKNIPMKIWPIRKTWRKFTSLPHHKRIACINHINVVDVSIDRIGKLICCITFVWNIRLIMQRNRIIFPWISIRHYDRLQTMNKHLAKFWKVRSTDQNQGGNFLFCLDRLLLPKIDYVNCTWEEFQLKLSLSDLNQSRSSPTIEDDMSKTMHFSSSSSLNNQDNEQNKSNSVNIDRSNNWIIFVNFLPNEQSIDSHIEQRIVILSVHRFWSKYQQFDYVCVCVCFLPLFLLWHRQSFSSVDMKVEEAQSDICQLNYFMRDLHTSL